MRGRLFSAAAVGLVGAACAASPRARTMTWPEYAARSPQWPYVLRIAHGSGELLYYGARHTYTASDPQIEEIERLWAAFRPTIAFNEGGHPNVESSRDRAVEQASEAGFVRFLAARDDVPVTTLVISRASTDYRDRFMVSLLSRHVANGHRVFAVVGGTHVVMQERALRECLASGGGGC